MLVGMTDVEIVLKAIKIAKKVAKIYEKDRLSTNNFDEKCIYSAGEDAAKMIENELQKLLKKVKGI